MQTCRGSLSATLLQPLPTSIVAGLDVHDRSTRNLKLADRFMIGVRDTGSLNLGGSMATAGGISASGT